MNFKKILSLKLKLIFIAFFVLFPLVIQADEIFSREEFPLTDFSNHTVPLEEFYSAGPPRDGIKAIDQPKFITVDEANALFDAREPVVKVSIGKDAKAYPLRILLYHEIVNDKLNGKSIFVTHCPLCNTAIVFNRMVDGRVLDFGTTGRVRGSNLIMYDRQTESWWQQFTGDAVVGEYAGTLLQSVASQIVSLAQFSESYPNGLVLSQKTGFRRYYGKTPYPGYDVVDGNPFLFRGDIDSRLPPLERVLGILYDSMSVIYPFSYLHNHPLINTEFEELPILLISQASMISTVDKKILKDSKTTLTAVAFSRVVNGKELDFSLQDHRIIDMQTKSEWNIFGYAVQGALKGAQLKQVDSNVHFAFAWLAFYPDSKIVTE